ncbi:MAG: EAL domain-containing protein [Xanthomonadales bacterium]|nr:EAL domain-containing protein [Xanthomonadales bacterium]
MSEKLDQITALIVCADVEAREAVSSVLSGRSVKSVYTADGITAADQFLSQLDVDLLIIDLGLGSEPIAQVAAKYGSSIKLMGLVADGDSDDWLKASTSVSEVIFAPLNPGEFNFRLDRLLGDETFGEGVRDEVEEELLFHGVDEEYVVSDPRSNTILEVNRPFVERSGQEEDHWLGQGLDALGLIEDPELEARRKAQLKRDGEIDFECDRNFAGHHERVAVARRMGMRHGRLVYLTRIRPVADEIAAASGSGPSVGSELLDALAPVFRAGSADLPEAMENLQRRLGFDLLLAVAVDRSQQMKVLASHGSGEGAAPSDVAGHAPFRKLLVGKEVVAPDDARQALGAEDPLVRKLGVQAYLAVPIAGKGGTTIGAVMGVARAPLEGVIERLGALRLLAGFFGKQLEIRQLKAQSETRSLHDALTGLPNRLLFNDRLDHALKEAARRGEMVALMFVDLDRFKTINDGLGHSIGDQVLASVTERLKAMVRKSDTVARYAGDEFTVILRHINHRDDVLRVAQKLNRALAEPIRTREGQDLQITASIGVSFFPDDGRNPEQLLKHADMAMFSAKGMGRNTTQSYVDEPEEEHEQRLKLESALRHAEKNNELRVYYQPQVSSATEDIVGMEALIRWEHPEQGLISPGFFIPIAEETGLIVPIGEWLLRMATRQTAEWQQRFGLPLTIGVNLSPLQLKQSNLVNVVEDALNAAGLEPQYLDLEVTESISIKSIPGLRERLEACRDLGCKISIDDFGTGQASLDYLKRFPADRIKVDQSFVRHIGVDPDDEAIVKATIAMAHSLNLGVIAEGVEEEGHLEFLRANGCEELQGYLFCRPLPTDSFSQLLLERESLMVNPAAASPDPA